MDRSEMLRRLNMDARKDVAEKYREAAELGKLPDVPAAFVFGDGTGSEKIVLVGEAPGKDEVREGRPFVGAAGKILDDFLKRSGIPRDQLYITNSVKYRLARPGKRQGTLANRPVKKFELEYCSSWLRNELDIIRPALVVTLGNTALAAVGMALGAELKDNIGELHGKALSGQCFSEGQAFTLIPLYHPASLIYNRDLRDDYEKDLQEVKKCAQSIL
jgi:DNA polymerase